MIDSKPTSFCPVPSLQDKNELRWLYKLDSKQYEHRNHLSLMFVKPTVVGCFSCIEHGVSAQ